MSGQRYQILARVNSIATIDSERRYESTSSLPYGQEREVAELDTLGDRIKSPNEDVSGFLFNVENIFTKLTRTFNAAGFCKLSVHLQKMPK